LSASQHVAGWLPPGRWKLIQLDNSNVWSPVEASFIGTLLGLSANAAPNSVLFEFGADNRANAFSELQIANVIFAVLLFEGHAYLASEGSNQSQLVGIQDGFVYLYSDTPTESAVSWSDKIPTDTPGWVLEIRSAWQAQKARE
jgi:hypothetical protein